MGTVSFFLQFGVLLAAIAFGARVGGVGLGAWGAVGLAFLAFGFGARPVDPPFDVILIIVAVVTAAATMEAAGGIDYLVRLAERVIRRNPRHITLVAPLVTFAFTFCSGTGHIVYPLLPVIYQVAYESGIRPERPLAAATIASQVAITCCPVSAATAAMLVLLDKNQAGLGLPGLLLITLPVSLLAVLLAALVQTRVGVELGEDPEYRRRLAEGKVEPPGAHRAGPEPLPAGASVSAALFLVGVALVVLAGAFPALRRRASMAECIQIVMLSVTALILLLARPPAEQVPRTRTSQAGTTAVIGILGLAWLGQTFIAANREVLIGSLTDMARAAPPLFAVGLFVASVFLFSQAATVAALMPLGFELGIPAPYLVAMVPAVNGYFFLPNYGTVIAAINFDRTGTTGIGRYVLNHSFMLPGLVSTAGAVALGLLIARLFF
jgi:anaerobic C4-dicarboxylate transporter DcuA